MDAITIARTVVAIAIAGRRQASQHNGIHQAVYITLTVLRHAKPGPLLFDAEILAMERTWIGTTMGLGASEALAWI